MHRTIEEHPKSQSAKVWVLMLTVITNTSVKKIA